MDSDNDVEMNLLIESTSMNNKPSTSSAETSDMEIITNPKLLEEPSTSKKYKTKDKCTRYGKLSLPLVLQSVGCEPNKYEEVCGKMKKSVPDEMELLSNVSKLLKKYVFINIFFNF